MSAGWTSVLKQVNDICVWKAGTVVSFPKHPVGSIHPSSSKSTTVSSRFPSSCERGGDNRAPICLVGEQRNAANLDVSTFSNPRGWSLLSPDLPMYVASNDDIET